MDFFGGGGPLTASDILEFAGRINRNSPTMQDAIRYASLMQRLSALLPGSKEERQSGANARHFGLLLRYEQGIVDKEFQAIVQAMQLPRPCTGAERERKLSALIKPVLKQQKEQAKSGVDARAGATSGERTVVMEPLFFAPECSICKAKGPGELLKCGKCRAVLYCSVACQRKGWKGGHKAACVPWEVARQSMTAELFGGGGGGKKT